MQYSKEFLFAFEPDPLFHLVSYHLFLYSQHLDHTSTICVSCAKQLPMDPWPSAAESRWPLC